MSNGTCGAFLACLWVAACASDAECDPGQKLTNGQCVTQAAGGSGAGTGGAGTGGTGGNAGSTGGVAGSSTGGNAGSPDGSADSSATGGAGGTCSSDAGTAFGTACSDGTGSTDCSCPAPYCAVQPGQTTGYCTHTGCKETPAVCPSGWSCLDLSVFQPGLPSICTKP